MQAQKFINNKINIVQERLYGKTMAPQPTYGYTPSPNMPDYLVLNSGYYDSNNYDVLYHEDASYQYWDPETTYSSYDPYGTFKYGPKNYVPSYTDSVLLSRTNGVRKNQYNNNNTSSFSYYPIETNMDIFHLNYFVFKNNDDNTNMNYDFCNDSKLTDQEKNDFCTKMSGSSNCTNSPCCVSIGRNKTCVYGDQTGPNPSFSTNNTSTNIQDYYIHQNKCYGNCVNEKTGYLNNTDRMMYMLPRPNK
jgi:hypothetical protein